MITKLSAMLYSALGIDCIGLNIAQMAFRTLIVYLMSLVLFRLNKRVLAQPSPFDFLFIIFYGSVISRAITGAVPFIPTLCAGLVLALLHTLLSIITFYSPKIGALIKGTTVILIKDGQIQWHNMRNAQLTQRDLFAALRRNAQILNPEDVKLSVLERNGEISVIPFERKIDNIEVEVKEGVQIIKIELKK